MKSTIFPLFLLLLLVGGFQSARGQLSEGFEGSFPPAGWAVLDNGVGTTHQWQKFSLNPNTGNAHAYVRFSNSTTQLSEDWLVTPRLLPDANNNTLTFFATDDFASNFFSTYTVQVSTTSQTDRGSFDIVETYLETDFTNDVYQQFTVDLSAYEGQEIYVAFVMQNANGDSFFLDDVSGPPAAAIATAPNCDAELTSPADAAMDVEVAANLVWSPATGDPTGYNLKIGTSPGGSEFLTQTDVGSSLSYDPTPDFAFNTTYYVTIVPYNAIGEATIGECTEFSFTTEINPDINLDCGGLGAPVNRTLCYANSEIEEFTISSNNSDQVRLTFNMGMVENLQDEIYIYDGTDDTGTLLNAGQLYGNAGDLMGLSYVSTTGSLFVRLTPDASNDCLNGNQTTIDYTASCASCTPPAGTATAGTCDGGNSEFFIDVDITDLGDGTVVVSNDQNFSTTTITTLGVTSVGPFSFGTVTLILENQADPNCDVELLPVTVDGCAPANDACANAIALTASSDQNCTNATSGSTEFATISNNEGICSFEDLDVWYSFTPGTTDDFIFELLNSNGSNSVAIYEGDCQSELILISEDCFSEGAVTVNLTQGQTYLVQVFTTDENFTGSFDICVFASPAPPANDLCADATVISCPDGGSFMGVDATFATAIDAASCNNDPIGAGVWYQIAGTGELLSITANPEDWDAEIQVWTGADCQNLTCLLRVDDGVTGVAESISELETMEGTNYYIYVGAFNANEPAGLFDFSVSCSGTVVTCQDNPVNDPCNDILVADGAVEGTVVACETIVTSGVVTVASGTSASFEAGTSITLTVGFTAEAGSEFNASIVNCNNANEETVESRSEIVAETAGLELAVQPNPAFDQMQVQIHLPKAGRMNIVLTDISGKTVRTLQQDGNPGWNQFSLERNDLADGMYFLTVLTASERKTIKIIFAK